MRTDVVLLMHGDTATGLSDSSAFPIAFTNAGGASASTSQSKFGNASLRFDAGNGYLYASNASKLDLPGDFTIEMWARPESLTTNHAFTKWNNPSPAWYFGLFFEYATILIQGPASNQQSFIIPSGVLSTIANQWHHYALCRSGSNLRAFVDGVQVGPTRQFSENLSGNSVFAINNNSQTLDNNASPLWLDELRITRAARYTENFPPPTAAFPDA
jgi:hypothetical protein